MKVVCFSDTHGLHAKLTIPECDLLIHAGDLSHRGTEKQIEEFCLWFSEQPARERVLICGNHDFLFQDFPERARDIVRRYPFHYLEDSGIDIFGLKIWGSPWQPWFHDWAFNLKTVEERADKWALIPDDTDILITHGPPHGIFDDVRGVGHVGCEALTKRLKSLSVKLHVFGHIHEGYGVLEKEGRTFVNACSIDLTYRHFNAPVVISL